MHDPTYSGRSPLEREQARIQAMLILAGVQVTGASLSQADGVADIAWQAGDGSQWMAVISPLDPELWVDWQAGAAPEGGPQDDAQDAQPAPSPGPAPEIEEDDQGGQS